MSGGDSKDRNPLLGKGHEGESSLSAVQEVFRELGQKFRGRMVSLSSGAFHIRLAEVEIGSMGELVDDPEYRGCSIFGQLAVDNPPLPGVLIVQRQLLTNIIGSMLGAPDPNEQEAAEARPLSPVELRVATRIFDELLRQMTLVWPGGSRPSIELLSTADTPRIADPANREEKLFTATLDLGPPDTPFGLMAVGLPIKAFRSLEIVPPLKEDGEPKKRMIDMSRVMPLEVELVVELARVKVPIKSLKDLNVGDVISLGPQESAVLRVNGRAVIKGEAGQSNGFRSLQVKEKLETES